MTKPEDLGKGLPGADKAPRMTGVTPRRRQDRIAALSAARAAAQARVAASTKGK